jgi:AcrR family transcriptional regulator
MNPVDTRTRILEAAVSCVEHEGLAKTSLEDVASEAGVSRATVYRYFSGGREQLVAETIAWEVANFLQRLADAVATESGLEAKLVRGLVVGHRMIHEHRLLQRVLRTEPEEFLAEFQPTMPLMGQLVQAELVVQLTGEQLRPDIDPDEAAHYLAHLFLSYLGNAGRWDLTDEDAVRRLVRTQFLAGVVEPA